MSQAPAELKYAESHEWVRVEGEEVVIGITDHAQEALGDVVFVETPEVGTALEAGAEAGVVESVKAASDIYAPVSGIVTAVNEALADAPETINESPYENGWFFRMTLANPAELEKLLDADAYKAASEG
jgi:glycine cleavage system H protein